ncbi:MAG: hypothetical protein AB1938_01930 [Myxococcota bacterium]
MNGSRWAAVAVVMALVGGCSGRGVTGVDPDTVRGPRLLDFGRVFVGYPATQLLLLQNPARVEREIPVAWPDPFQAESPVRLGPGLEVAVAVTIRATSVGPVERQVEIDGWTLTLRARVEEPPFCDAGPCQDASFEPDAGTCVVQAAPEDAPCTDGCLVAGHCRQGRCEGTAISCTDGNPCTLDVCTPGLGCEYPEKECAVPPAACLVPYCDPITGCGATAVVDGVRCGPDDCVANTAQVCINGACVQRARPTADWCVTVVGGRPGGWGVVDGTGEQARLWSDPFVLDERGVVTTIHDQSPRPRVRRIGATGAVATTVSGMPGTMASDGLGVAVLGQSRASLPQADPAGNVWFVDGFPLAACLRTVSPLGLVRTVRCLSAGRAIGMAPGAGGAGYWVARATGAGQVATLIGVDGGVLAEVPLPPLVSTVHAVAEADGGLLIAAGRGVSFVGFDGGSTSLAGYNLTNCPQIHDFARSGEWLVSECNGPDCELRLEAPGGRRTVLGPWPGCAYVPRARINRKGEVVALFNGGMADLLDGGWRERAGARVDTADFFTARSLVLHEGGVWRFDPRGQVGVGDGGLWPGWPTIGSDIGEVRECGGALLAAEVLWQQVDAGACARRTRFLPDGGWSTDADTCNLSQGGTGANSLASLTCPGDDVWGYWELGGIEVLRVHLADGTTRRWRFPYTSVTRLIARDAQGLDFATRWAVGSFVVDGGATILAGNPGQPGEDDGMGATARFSQVLDFSIADDGTRFVADFGASSIRTVSPAGVVTTIIRLQDGPLQVQVEPGPNPGLWITVQDALLYARPPP